jgi:hypothetical protein
MTPYDDFRPSSKYGLIQQLLGNAAAGVNTIAMGVIKIKVTY